MPLVFVTLLAVLPLVLAQSSTEDDGLPSFSLDKYNTGTLARNAVVILLLIPLVVFSYIAIKKHPNHKIPFLLLLPSLVCSILGDALFLIRLVIAGFTSYTPPRTLGTGLESSSSIMSAFAFVLQFFAVVALLNDRYSDISAAVDNSPAKLPAENVWKIIHFLSAFAVFVISMSAVAVNIKIDEMFRNGSVPVEDILPWVQTSANLMYASEAFIFVVAVDIFTLAAVTYAKSHKERFNDKITSMAMFALAPVYLISAIVSIGFTIALSSPISTEKELHTRPIILLVWSTITQSFGLFAYALQTLPGIWSSEDWLVKPSTAMSSEV